MEIIGVAWYACFLSEKCRLNVRQPTKAGGAVGDPFFLSLQAIQTRLFHGTKELGPRPNGGGR